MTMPRLIKLLFFYLLLNLLAGIETHYILLTS